jgi:hypothetical protein
VAVTPASFRQAFPQFKNPDKFGDFAITMWSGIAYNLLDPVRWDVMLDYGAMLYTAHRLVLMERDVLTAIGGGIPGAVTGVLTAKAIDKVSSSYDAQSVTLEDGGDYNMTRYGIELLKLMRQFGMGGLQMSGVGEYGPGCW